MQNADPISGAKRAAAKKKEKDNGTLIFFFTSRITAVSAVLLQHGFSQRSYVQPHSRSSQKGDPYPEIKLEGGGGRRSKTPHFSRVTSV